MTHARKAAHTPKALARSSGQTWRRFLADIQCPPGNSPGAAWSGSKASRFAQNVEIRG